MQRKVDDVLLELLAVFTRHGYKDAEIVGALTALAVVMLADRYPGSAENAGRILEELIARMRSDLQERLARNASVKH